MVCFLSNTDLRDPMTETANRRIRVELLEDE